VSPVTYELRLYIPEDGILHAWRVAEPRNMCTFLKLLII
jgi:hypothetical protein